MAKCLFKGVWKIIEKIMFGILNHDPVQFVHDPKFTRDRTSNKPPVFFETFYLRWYLYLVYARDYYYIEVCHLSCSTSLSLLEAGIDKNRSNAIIACFSHALCCLQY